jgi:hypothetical protein
MSQTTSWLPRPCHKLGNLRILCTVLPESRQIPTPTQPPLQRIPGVLFPGVSGQSFKLTTHYYLLSNLRRSAALPHMPSWPARGHFFAFTFYFPLPYPDYLLTFLSYDVTPLKVSLNRATIGVKNPNQKVSFISRPVMWDKHKMYTKNVWPCEGSLLAATWLWLSWFMPSQHFVPQFTKTSIFSNIFVGIICHLTSD